MKASIVTLGCKINQCESESLASVLTHYGYEVDHGEAPADLFLINTCAVTGEAERKSRQTVRRIAKRNPEARIVVMGCSAQRDHSPFREIPGVICIGGTYDKYGTLKDFLDGVITPDPFFLGTSYVEYPSQTRFRTREYVKVQDGCNRFCSYCIVPYLRGRSVSRREEDILSQIAATQAKEIVITGIDLSAYGKDTDTDLVALLNKIEHPRVRFGSLEPNVITEAFLDAVAADRYCKHFHLSMQSGSDGVLKAMNRHYTSEEFIEKVRMIRSRFPDALITTDIIAGFPTETQEQHNETLTTVAEVRFGDAHVFPYSERSGTKAAKMEQVPKAVRSERAHEIAALCRTTRQAFLTSQLNKTHVVLTEQAENGFVTGYTQNYIKVYLNADTPLNELVTVVPTELYLDGVK